MKIFCAATTGDTRQLENLCECIKILGGKPEVRKNGVVIVECEGENDIISTFAELFSQYSEHEIRIRKWD